MTEARQYIREQLQQEILSLQGFKTGKEKQVIDPGLGPVNRHFPNAVFPVGAIHELVSSSPEETAASTGFISALLPSFMQEHRKLVWIDPTQHIFPPGLSRYGIQPQHILFIKTPKEKDMLWAFEEALKCKGLAAVVGNIRSLSFTESRRLQLAVEKSRVTGFIIRQSPRNPAPIAAVARWHIHSLPSLTEENLPGIGFPRWKVELQKIRNGKPGSWELEWRSGRFRIINNNQLHSLPLPTRKTG
jgi:protein ImuA